MTEVGSLMTGDSDLMGAELTHADLGAGRKLLKDFDFPGVQEHKSEGE